MRYLILLTLLFGCAVAHADNLKVVSIESDWMRPAVRARVAQCASAYWMANAGQKIKINKPLIRQKDPFKAARTNGQASFYSFYEEFMSWWLTLSANKIYNYSSGVGVHVLAPPFVINNSSYMGGWAMRGKRYSYSTALDYNTRSQPRFRHSCIAMAHELGHSIFGCEHEEGYTLMNIAILGMIGNPSLPVGNKCLAKIKG